MSVDHLLFFGDRGNGDLVGFPYYSEGVRNDVFLWNHEDDSWMNQAVSLRDWLKGKRRWSMSCMPPMTLMLFATR